MYFIYRCLPNEHSFEEVCRHRVFNVELLLHEGFDAEEILSYCWKYPHVSIRALRLLGSDDQPLTVSGLLSHVSTDLTFIEVCKLASKIEAVQGLKVCIPLIYDLPVRATNNTELCIAFNHLFERVPISHMGTHLLIENLNSDWEQIDISAFKSADHSVFCQKSINLSPYSLEQISDVMSLINNSSNFSGYVYLPSVSTEDYLSALRSREEEHIKTVFDNKTLFPVIQCLLH